MYPAVAEILLTVMLPPLKAALLILVKPAASAADDQVTEY